MMSEYFAFVQEIPISYKIIPKPFSNLLFRPQGSILPHILLPLSLFLSLASPPFRFRGILWTIIISFLVYVVWRDPWPSSPEPRYALNSAWFFFLPVIEKVLLHVPEKEFWNVEREKEEGIRYVERNEWGKKCWWAAALLCNPRGVGWNFESKHIPKVSGANERRWQFLVKKFFWAGVWYVVADMMGAILRRQPEFPMEWSWEGKVVQRLLVANCVMAVVTYASWSFQWTVASIVGVGFGLSRPKDWPPFLGSIFDCTTVGRFWGTFWQQLLHQSLLGFSRAINLLLHIPRGTKLSYLVHLLFGFFVTAFFHWFSISAVTDLSSHFILTNVSIFFMAQALAILVESIVLDFFRNCHGKAELPHDKLAFKNFRDIAGRMLGYLWTVSWLIVTGWWFTRVYTRVGMQNWRLPFPIAEPLLKHLR